MHLIHLPSIDSTNLYCERLDLREVEAFTVVWADHQTAGIGQRGNRWASRAGENLTFSLVLKPHFLAADRQFGITKMLSLALCDLLAEEGVEGVAVKWPNDIYIRRRKVCGMLVSNHLQGAQIAASVCGIGLNVNQTLFPPELPNPTSLRLSTGRQYPLEPLLHRLLAHLHLRYEQAEQGIDHTAEYYAHLMGYHQEAPYLYHGQPLRATILGTDPLGHLLLRTADGQSLCCGLKEISPIL